MRTLDYLGLDEKKVQVVVDNLAVLLADLQVYYANLRGWHWNVKGHDFFPMHEMYEKLYDDVAAKADEVAERILQLGGKPENHASAYLQVSEVKEAGEVHNGHEAFNALLDTLKILIARERRIAEVASEAHDETTVAIMDDFLKGQEKTVWMLVARSAKPEEK